MLNPDRRKRGFVLLSVLLMVVMLSVVLLDFNHESTMNVRLADNHLRSQRALLCAEAGLSIARAAVASAIDVDADAIKMLLAGTTVRIGDGEVQIKITPESGKLNVHKLVDEEGKPNRQNAEQMLRLIDALNEQYEGAPASYEIVPSLIDWIDSDNEVTRLDLIQRRNEGAEDDYYRRLPQSYHSKNGRLDTVSEMLLVKGITREIFEGTDDVPGLRDMVTIYGEGRINLRHAPAEVIQSLSENITREQALAFVRMRELEQADDPALLGLLAGLPAEEAAAIARLAGARDERFFSVTVTGEAMGLQRRIHAVVRKTGNDAKVIFREER